MRPGDFSSHTKKEDLSSSLSSDLIHSAFVPQVIRLTGDPNTCGYTQDQCNDPKDQFSSSNHFILLSVDVFNPIDNPLVGIQLGSPECVGGIAAEDDFSFIVVDVDDGDFFHSV
jgi:hypothetical protein